MVTETRIGDDEIGLYHVLIFVVGNFVGLGLRIVLRLLPPSVQDYLARRLY